MTPESACPATPPTTRIDARPASSGGTVRLVSPLLAAAVLWLGCDAAPELPEAPTASDGLVVLLPSGVGGADVAVVRLSDGRVQLLTATPDMPKSSPLWVPSIQQVLFVATTPGTDPPRSRLLIVDPLTARTQTATDRSADHEEEPAVSPDGRQVVYRFAGPTLVGNAEGIKIVRAMTASERLLRVPPTHAWFRHPRFAPDSLAVAVEVRRRAGGGDLWILYERSEGEAARILVEDRGFSDLAPRFSRDGREVWFERSRAVRPGPGDALGGGDVCAVDVETKAVRCLDAGSPTREYAVEPSPVRDEVVFLRESGGESELRISDTRGESGRLLMRAPGPDPRDPRWSPDGERIAFAWGPPEAPRVTVVDRSGELVLETNGSSPAWAPPLFPGS